MNIAFTDCQPSISDQVIIFIADVDGKTVPCKVSYEFLQDINPAFRNSLPLEQFSIHRSEIYKRMKDKLLNGDEPLLTTSDLS